MRSGYYVLLYYGKKTGGKNVRVRVGALYMGARHGELVLECARSMRISGSVFERVLDGQSGWDDQWSF